MKIGRPLRGGLSETIQGRGAGAQTWVLEDRMWCDSKPLLQEKPAIFTDRLQRQ